MNKQRLVAISACIFDLDGTLIDSKMDLVNSVNAMLHETGRPQLAPNLIASYVGHGAPQLIASTLGPNSTEEQRADALAIFLKRYSEQKLFLTRTYPGVTKGLQALNGTPMAVLSNKPTKMSVGILEGLGLSGYFRAIYGGDSFATKKPDPAGALAILKVLGVPASESAMVGDSDVDVQTARNAGMLAINVNYGFGQHDRTSNPADLYINSLTELVRLTPATIRMRS